MVKINKAFLASITTIFVSPLILGSTVFAAQPSLSVDNVVVSSNECESISGSFKVTNGGGASGSNTSTKAVLQAHVPPSAGGQAKFFPIKEISLPNQNIASGETQKRTFSIGGFNIPENTNSIRVEIMVTVAERDKVFISRSESFKPAACGAVQDEPEEPGITSDEPGVQEGPKVLSEKIEAEELPATGANEIIIFLILGSIFVGIYLYRISNKLA